MLVIVKLCYERTNIKSHMVYRCSFSNVHQSSSHSSFIPSWLVLLLQVKTQHPQTSVHGILFLWQLHLHSHPLLHLHFIRYSIASGAGGFKLRTGEKWLEPWLCSVCDEYASPVNQKLMESFLLRLHDLSRGASEAHLLLCGFVIDKAHIQMRRQINHQHTKYSRRRWNSCHKLGYHDWPNEDVSRFCRLLSGDNL